MDGNRIRPQGLAIDYKQSWSDLKDQIFYERNGRFAKKEDNAVAFNTTHDASSLIELCARDNKIVELFAQFQQAELDTQRTRGLTSQNHEQGVKEEN